MRLTTKDWEEVMRRLPATPRGTRLRNWIERNVDRCWWNGPVPIRVVGLDEAMVEAALAGAPMPDDPQLRKRVEAEPPPAVPHQIVRARLRKKPERVLIEPLRDET